MYKRLNTSKMWCPPALIGEVSFVSIFHFFRQLCGIYMQASKNAKETNNLYACGHTQADQQREWLCKTGTYRSNCTVRLILHWSVLCFVLHELAAFLWDYAPASRTLIPKAKVTVINNLRTVLELKNHYFRSLIFYYQFCPHRCHCHHWFWVLL